MLIAFSGKRGTGKSSAANYLVKTHGYKKISFADRLKEYSEILAPGIVSKMTLHNKEKAFFKNGETRRDFMIKLGQFMRYYDDSYWIKAAGIDTAGWPDVVVDDCRFANEAEYIKSLGGKIIRINRYPKLNVYGPEELDDPSETDLDHYRAFDFVIHDCVNVSLNDLYKQVNNALNEFES